MLRCLLAIFGKKCRTEIYGGVGCKFSELSIREGRERCKNVQISNLTSQQQLLIIVRTIHRFRDISDGDKVKAMRKISVQVLKCEKYGRMYDTIKNTSCCQCILSKISQL